jgi:hypothetical protein
MKSWKNGLGALGAAAMVFAGASTAAADPTNAKNGEVLELQCDGGLGTLVISTNGNGDWTPGLVTTSNQVLIPYRFHFEGSFTPVGGATETFSEDEAKPAPRNGRHAVCTFHEEGSDQFGSFVFDGTAWVSYTPAH